MYSGLFEILLVANNMIEKLPAARVCHHATFFPNALELKAFECPQIPQASTRFAGSN